MSDLAHAYTWRAEPEGLHVHYSSISHNSHLLMVNAVECRQKASNAAFILISRIFFSPLWIWYYTLYRVTVVPAEAKLSSRTEIVKLSWTKVNGNPTEPTLRFLSILVERCQWWDQPKSTKSFGCFEVFRSRGLTSCVVTTGKMRKRDFEFVQKCDWESKSPNDRQIDG